MTSKLSPSPRQEVRTTTSGPPCPANEVSGRLIVVALAAAAALLLWSCAEPAPQPPAWWLTLLPCVLLAVTILLTREWLPLAQHSRRAECRRDADRAAATYDDAPVCLAWCDRQQRVVRLNAGLADLCSRPATQLVGQPVEAVLPAGPLAARPARTGLPHRRAGPGSRVDRPAAAGRGADLAGEPLPDRPAGTARRGRAGRRRRPGRQPARPRRDGPPPAGRRADRERAPQGRLSGHAVARAAQPPGAPCATPSTCSCWASRPAARC